MKFFALCSLALVASSSAHGIVAPVGLAATGKSAVFRTEDNLGNYAFGYNEDHATGGSFRKEKAGPGFMVGSYGLKDLDGRQRIVNYVADAMGFRAAITSNEPGVDVRAAPAAVDYTIPVAAPILKTFAAGPLVKTFAEPLALAAPAIKTFAAAPIAVAAPAITSFSTHTAHVEPLKAVVAAPLAHKIVANTWAAPAAITNYGIDHVTSKVVTNAWGAPAIANFGLAPKVLAAPAIAPLATKVVANAWGAPALANFAGDWASPMAATKIL